jgi:hypothetical protein
VQLDFDETSALDTQLAVIEQAAAIAVGRKSDTVIPPERTEARKAGLLAASYASEERLEGFIQPAEHLLAAGEVGQSNQPFGAHRLQLVGLVVVVDALAANFPSLAPFLQGGVVQVASLVELVLEKLNLGFVGVKAVFVSESHLLSLALDVFAHYGCTRDWFDQDSAAMLRTPHRMTFDAENGTCMLGVLTRAQEYTKNTGLRQTKGEDEKTYDGAKNAAFSRISLPPEADGPLR